MMTDELATIFLNEKFYYSAYILTLSRESVISQAIHIVSSYNLGFLNSIKEIFNKENLDNVLEYKEVAIIYIRLSNKDIKTVPSKTIEPINNTLIGFDSIKYYWMAYENKEMIRKRLLVKSLECSNNNLEAILTMFFESMITYVEFNKYISNIRDNDLNNVLINFVNEFDRFDNPFNLLVFVYKMYDNINLLSRIAFHRLYAFSDTYVLKFVNGLYYLKTGIVESSIEAFDEVINLNRYFGLAYLYKGIAKSMLREMEESKANIKIAYQIMENNPIVAYYLAFEYFVGCDFNGCKFYLDRMIRNINKSEKKKLNTNKVSLLKKITYEIINLTISKDYNDNLDAISKYLINFYLFVLIANEEYGLAKDVLDEYTDLDPLLQAFYYLFNGEYDKSMDVMEQNDDSPYFMLLKGYLAHLVDNFDTAVFYYKSTKFYFEDDKIVNDLILLAMETKNTGIKNKACVFASCLFDLLPYKKRKLFLFM
ncbi:hypothetical protein A0H76_12 [Hepatospora eriocheir]|uniref:Uncharacterized protein n=1 Tax=Hepatospora eriocheir TaxID=1081669 RepID=A0A1X0QLN9_9MICR|nr:hypothetical protein A0H76_12 [Hepatospora eriocheir]